MKGKQLVILVIIAAALATTAIITSRDTTMEVPSEIGNAVLDDFDVNKVEQITITKGKDTLNLALTKDVWTCPDKKNYPLKYDRIRDTLLKFNDLKIQQVMTVNDEQRKAMGMIAPPAAGSGTLVKMNDANGKELASILVGEMRKSEETSKLYTEQGWFVSPDKGKTIYMVAERFFHLTTEANGWVDTALISVPTEQIQTLSLTTEDAGLVTISRSDGEITVDGLKPNEEFISGAADNLLSAIGSLHFNDVIPAGLPPEDTGLDIPIAYIATTTSGIVYDIKIGKPVPGPEERYFSISARLSDNIEAEPEKLEELKKTVNDINNRLSKWIYTLATYKTDNMISARSNLVRTKSGREMQEEAKKAKE
ncbi:hypothetical protein BVX97_05325 [bacterium E08(2017)]|nr:hypothetical protein BVX97_05325 [bacterium E08(2017)]